MGLTGLKWFSINKVTSATEISLIFTVNVPQSISYLFVQVSSLNLLSVKTYLIIFPVSRLGVADDAIFVEDINENTH